jgi:anti-anti-sigma factor
MNKNASAADPTPERDRSNVVPLKGEIDLHVSPSVTASLNSMIEKKPQRLVVDLSGVTYIDSAGLAALIGAMQKVEGYGGKFLLADYRKPCARFSKSRGSIRYFRFSQTRMLRWLDDIF